MRNVLPSSTAVRANATSGAVRRSLEAFSEFGRKTKRSVLSIKNGPSIPIYTNEFWTSKQRAGHSIHEVSYRACFKPQLPAFFIERFSSVGDIVYDPFAGRGTTLIEAALRDRVAYGSDVNPLSEYLIVPRIRIPSIEEVEQRLAGLRLTVNPKLQLKFKPLLAFFHRRTLAELIALRTYFLRREKSGKLDAIDRWIWMVAINRLTGHSPGFFSGYTLPPNQAVSVESQIKINKRLGRQPERKDVLALIARKSRFLMRDAARPSARAAQKARVFIESASSVPRIKANSVELVVTSPPFLDIVDYVSDNWLRAWFANVDLSEIPVWQFRQLEDWKSAMQEVFRELRRVLKPGGHIAFEVGEVRNACVRLEEAVSEAGHAAGLEPLFVLVNEQKFTKTSNCWGVKNQERGTNTNRVVVFRKLNR